MSRAEHAFAAMALALCLGALACPRPPVPPPNGPGGAGGSVAAGTGGTYVEPGPVPYGDVTKCATACRHVDQIRPGALGACTASCSRAGGANPDLVACWAIARTEADLQACGRPAGASGGALPHGR